MDVCDGDGDGDGDDDDDDDDDLIEIGEVISRILFFVNCFVFFFEYARLTKKNTLLLVPGYVSG